LLNENASIQLLGNSTSSRTRTVDGHKKQVATNENCILWLIPLVCPDNKEYPYPYSSCGIGRGDCQRGKGDSATAVRISLAIRNPFSGDAIS